MAAERMKDANWHFTKDLCSAIGKIKNPTKELSDLADKFMFMLDQKERSWKFFKVYCSIIMKNEI